MESLVFWEIHIVDRFRSGQQKVDVGIDEKCEEGDDWEVRILRLLYAYNLGEKKRARRIWSIIDELDVGF